MAGNPPKICAAIVNEDLDVVEGVAPLIDLFEVRIDLIGKGWRKVAVQLKKPWIACNRRVDEGGKWAGREPTRLKELRDALDLGASIIDIELATPSLTEVVNDAKGKAECLISYHNLKETPPLDRLRQIIINQLAAGAHICKVVTTARNFTDNLAVLQLITDFSSANVVSFATGTAGQISRILCPLVGGYFTYASTRAGKESAKGQISVISLREIYRMLSHDK